MKTFKKIVFSIAFCFSIILGIAFSFVPQDASADVGGGIGNKVICWSSGTASPGDEYISCASCALRLNRKATGPQSKCKPSNNPT